MTGSRSREDVIRQHLPLVEVAARKFVRAGEPLEDLVQVGTIGLINAVDRFDPERGTPFASFALAYVVGEIQRHLRDRCAVVRVPRAAARRSIDVRRAASDLAERLGRSPTGAELAAATGLDPTEVGRVLAARAPAPLPDDGIADVAGEDAYEAGEARVLVAAAARPLDARQRRLLHLRYFRGLSQHEIAREVGLSQVHVSRLLDGALRTMRAALEGGADPAH